MTRLSRLPKHLRELNPQIDAQTRRAAAGVEDVADHLQQYLRTLAPDVPPPVRDQPAGPFRIDLAWPDLGLAVEVNGGYSAPRGGKHGSVRDHEKMRAIALAGWLVLVFAAEEVRHDPDKCIADIRAAVLAARELEHTS
jgi:very-short-patch-repair endonuclease